MSESPLGWGLLGTARINRSLIPPLRTCRGSRLVAVASRDFARAEAYGREWGIGCYPLGFTQFLLDAAPVEVFGSQTIGPTGVDETFAGELVFGNGVLAQIDCGLRTPVRAELEVAGTKGVLRVRHPWKPDPAQPMLLRQGEETVEVGFEARDRYLLEIEDLESAVRTGAPPRVSLAESRRGVRTITALRQSAREGRPIRL